MAPLWSWADTLRPKYHNKTLKSWVVSFLSPNIYFYFIPHITPVYFISGGHWTHPFITPINTNPDDNIQNCTPECNSDPNLSLTIFNSIYRSVLDLLERSGGLCCVNINLPALAQFLHSHIHIHLFPIRGNHPSTDTLSHWQLSVCIVLL